MVLSAFSASFYYLERQTVTRVQKETERKTLEKLSAACEEAELQQSAVVAINFVNLLKKDPAVLSAACIGAQDRYIAHTQSSNIGRLIYESELKRLQAADGVLEEIRFSDGKDVLSLSTPIILAGRKAGLAEINYDFGYLRERINESLFTTLRRVILISSAIFLIAFLAALLLAALYTRPIDSLVKGTQEIAAGNLSHKIDASKRIRELGVLADKFNAMAERLTEVDRLKAGFLENVTHDMRAPLQAVSGYVELMMNGHSGPVNEKQLKQLNVIHVNLKRLAEFISDILDLTQLEAHSLQIEPRPVLVQDCVETVREMLEASAAQYKIDLSSECDDDLPVIYGDAKLIDRLITNLAYNAFKFTPEGGKVTVRAARLDSQWLRLEVQDTGVGIPEDKLKSVFEKFFQVAETRHLSRKAGTGLGLTIVKGIVELHGGRIWAESRLGQGTKFIVLLPFTNPSSTRTDSRGS